MRRAGAWAVLCIVAVGACAEPAALSRAARGVLVMRGTSQPTGGPPLGRVRCDVSFWSEGHDYNAIACENELLNQAAQMGGATVVVDEMRVTPNEAHMSAVVYGAAADAS